MCLKKPEVDGNGMPFFFLIKKRIVSINNCFPKRLLVKQNDFSQFYIHDLYTLIYRAGT